MLSGGKDSNYAIWRAVNEGFEIACIATVRPRRRDSWMFHFPITEIVKLQVSLIDIPAKHFEIEVSGEKEKEVYELLSSLKKIKDEVDFDHIVIGGIASLYQKRRFALIADKLNVKLYSPQWGKDPSKYLLELISNGFEFIITEIKVYGLDKRFLGVIIDEKAANDIIKRSKKYGFNPAFEGGEAESLVLYQPLFKDKRICITGVRRSLSEFEHVVEIFDSWIGNRTDSCLSIKDFK